jgi:NADPH:quinone reductase-like Zn-dependent oxidoreductase
MKAWHLQNFGLQNLKLVDAPTPRPGPNELLVRVSAVSLNFRDKAIVDGIYEPETIPKPLIPVSDAAGVVVDAGPNVTRFKSGDRVTSHLYSKWLDGSERAEILLRRSPAGRLGRVHDHPRGLGRACAGQHDR